MNYTYLVSGLIMMSESTYVIFKVYKGSKSHFVYALMAFTFIDGSQNFAFFFIYFYLQPIQVDGQTIYALNMYAF